MLIINGGNVECLPMATDRESPFSTSFVTSASTPLKVGFGVCSARMVRQRRIGRPDASIVANCRLKTARSFGFTRALKISTFRFMPVLLTRSTAIGVIPWLRTLARASASLTAVSFDSTRRPERARALTRYSLWGTVTHP